MSATGTNFTQRLAGNSEGGKRLIKPIPTEGGANMENFLHHMSVDEGQQAKMNKTLANQRKMSKTGRRSSTTHEQSHNEMGG